MTEESEGLTLSITRDVEPKEISYLVFGTGALSYPWWKDVDWVCVVDGEEFPIEGEGYANLDTAEPDDYLIFQYDDPEDDEGTFRGKKKVTFREVVAAAGIAIRKGYVREPDAIKEDLGMCDAEEADAVLQLAVFGGEDTVYG